MKVVSPYRPFTPESNAHLRLGVFDWQDALSMLRERAYFDATIGSAVPA